MKKKNLKILSIFLIILLLSTFYFKFLKKEESHQTNTTATNEESSSITKEESFSSNIIENVNYSSKDIKGNEYIIDATQGEIDFSDTKIIYLTNVRALIKLINSNNIEIKSDYGKYNTENFDTIFSQNVIINYLDNVITSEYLDFSIKRNSMIISRNVIYTNLENILKADVIEMNVQTKDTKIFMYKNNEKVNIKSKN